MRKEELLSIYPAGKDKCMLAAVVGSEALCASIINIADMEHEILSVFSRYKIKAIILENSLKPLNKLLLKLDLKTNVIFFDAKISQLEIKRRYFSENKAQGLSCLLPVFLRKVTDLEFKKYAAVLLAEKFSCQP